jgi:histidinol-phosphatase (PHP family)
VTASTQGRGAAPAPVPDYHVHSRFSDGRDDPETCVARALELGLPELGFADHLSPRRLGEDAYFGRAADWLDDYVETVRRVAARHPELPVLLGVEAEFLPEAAGETLATLAAYPFDYALCAVHYVDGFGFDEADKRDAPGWRDADRVYRGYYETLTAAVRSGAFDAVAHFDLPKLWGQRPSADLTGLEDELLGAVAAAGMAIEINTSGRDRHPVGEAYPAPAILRRAREAGIPVIFGSDAHRAAEVASSFPAALALARRAGYKGCLRLSDRRQVPLAAAGRVRRRAGAAGAV